MSLGAMFGTLSSLKLCQSDLMTGMDIVTDVAMDLAETMEGEESEGLKELENVILVCAKLDRDINYFVDTVKEVTREEATSRNPEVMFSLSDQVKRLYEEKIANLSETELHKHQKVIAFKESIRNCQAAQSSAGNVEQLDEDVAVTQTEENFTCPLTQVEMVHPVKNKTCNHFYDKEAILNLIKSKHNQKKKCRCPVVGCGNSDVKESDLVLDQVLRRKIQSQKRNSNKTC